MHISVIGTGYLGATHAACLASTGHHVVGIDRDATQIARLCEALGIQVSDVDHPREDEDPSGISSPETESGSSPAWVPAVAGSSDDLEFDAAPPPRGPP